MKTMTYNECILPVTTYGTEAWILTKKIISKLQVHQRLREQKLLGISLSNRIINKWIRQKTKVENITKRIRAFNGTD